MEPTKHIYTTATQRVKNTDLQYKDPDHLENNTASEYGQDANGAKSPEEEPMASITLPRPSRKGNPANDVDLKTFLKKRGADKGQRKKRSVSTEASTRRG